MGIESHEQATHVVNGGREAVAHLVFQKKCATPCRAMQRTIERGGGGDSNLRVVVVWHCHPFWEQHHHDREVRPVAGIHESDRIKRNVGVAHAQVRRRQLRHLRYRRVNVGGPVCVWGTGQMRSDLLLKMPQLLLAWGRQLAVPLPKCLPTHCRGEGVGVSTEDLRISAIA